MSIIDDFMSKVVDLDEKEKEETILFLAEALVNDNYEFLKSISKKVQFVVLAFLTSISHQHTIKTKCFLCKEEKECAEAIIYNKQKEYKNVYFCLECTLKKYGRR